MLYGLMPPLDQCSVTWKSPSATSAFHAFTLRAWKVASMPAALSCCAAIESTSDMSVYAAGEMMLNETVLPPFWKKPLLPLVNPAFSSTFAAAAGFASPEMVIDDTGALHAENVGSVMPVAFRTGFSRPASPSKPRILRLTARLIACRTASWLVGHFVRFPSRL